MKVQNFDYDDIPPGYYHEVLTSGSNGHQFWHRQKFNLVAQTLRQPIGTLLDVGCGPGSFFFVLQEMGIQIDRRIGSDLCDKQVAYAQQLLQDIEWISADAAKLPFEDNTLDAITMIEVLEHFPPEREALVLKEFLRVLQPGGQLVMTTPNYRSHWPLIEWLWERMSPVKYGDQHLNKKNLSSLESCVSDAGFQVTSTSSFFVGSPLCAVLSQCLGEATLRFERRWLPRIGAICLIAARKPARSVNG